ncbi:MAG: hypothetical protein ACLU4N_00850 [Butyricimonas faecihominis]
MLKDSPLSVFSSITKRERGFSCLEKRNSFEFASCPGVPNGSYKARLSWL